MNTEGSVAGSQYGSPNAIPLVAGNDGAFVQMEPAQPVVMVHQTPAQVVQPYQYQQNEAVYRDDSDNAYSGAVSDLTICHWLACLFCNCCGCALVGLILNEVVMAAKSSGYHKLAYFIWKKAKCWMLTACICTFLPWIIFIILFATGGLTTSYLVDSLINTENDTNP